MHTINEVKIPKAEVKKWVKALRSRKYKQTREKLEDGNGFCCLGVACKLAIPRRKQLVSEGYLYGTVPDSSDQPASPDWLQAVDQDFYRKTGKNLTQLNDDGISFIDDSSIHRNPFTFDEIADCLEAVYIHEVLA